MKQKILDQYHHLTWGISGVSIRRKDRLWDRLGTPER